MARSELPERGGGRGAFPELQQRLDLECCTLFIEPAVGEFVLVRAQTLQRKPGLVGERIA